MFDMPWIVLCWPDVPIETGATVAVLVSHAGFWSLNACRIAYVLQERRILEKYGFAYGTLHDHGEIGEERFTVEFNPPDGSVWYDLYAFSRPGPAARPGCRLAQQCLDGGRRGWVGWDSGELLHHLHYRPVGDALAVRQAPAACHARLDRGEGLRYQA